MFREGLLLVGTSVIESHFLFNFQFGRVFFHKWSLRKLLFVDCSLGLRLFLFFFNLLLIELLVVILAIDSTPKIGHNIASKFIEGLLHKEGLIVDIGSDDIIQFAIVPAELDVIEDLLSELILAFVVLPPDQIQISGFFDDLLVVLESKS